MFRRARSPHWLLAMAALAIVGLATDRVRIRRGVPAAIIPAAVLSDATASIDRELAPTSSPAPHPVRLNPRERWHRAAAMLSSFERDAEIAALLEELAGTDPAVASELLLTLPEDDRRRAVAAVLLDAARQPARAVQLANDFVRSDPQVSMEHGYALVSVLTRAGEYDAAQRFVQLHAPTMGDSENPNKWLNAIYSAWAKREPAVAALHAAALPNSGIHGEPLRTVAETWAGTDPRAATEFVAGLTAGLGPNAALDLALLIWAEKDPSAMALWVSTAGAREELDRGAMALATSPHVFDQRPADALSWANRVVDPALRSQTIARVLRTWSDVNLDDARRHAETAPGLLPEDRATLLTALNRPPD